MKAISAARISRPGQDPQYTGAAFACHRPSPGTKAHLPCHSQSSSGPARPAGLRTTSGLFDFKNPKAALSSNQRAPPGRLGTRSLDRSNHDVPGGLCNQSPWCWGAQEDPSLAGRPASVKWPRRGRFRASQALGDRPSGPPSPPSPRPARESLSGPRSSRAWLHDAGLRLASVPATATAWQQRAPGAVAINNPPAAAAVRPPAALGCKYAALSALSAPTAPAGIQNLHRPFLIT